MNTKNYDWKKELEEQERREQRARETSLHEAFHDIEEFKRRLAGGADLEERDEYGNTPLLASIGIALPLRKKIELIELLLDAGADINAQGSKYSLTALHGALDEPVLLKYLLSKGADTTLRNSSDKTPLEWARFWKHGEAVEILEPITPEAAETTTPPKPSFWKRTHTLDQMLKVLAWTAVVSFVLTFLVLVLIFSGSAEARSTPEFAQDYEVCRSVSKGDAELDRCQQEYWAACHHHYHVKLGHAEASGLCSIAVSPNENSGMNWDRNVLDGSLCQVSSDTGNTATAIGSGVSTTLSSMSTRLEACAN